RSSRSCSRTSRGQRSHIDSPVWNMEQATESVEFELPIELVNSLRSAAHSRRTSPDRVLAEVLAATLTPGRAEYDAESRELLLRTARLPEDELRSRLDRKMDELEERRLS